MTTVTRDLIRCDCGHEGNLKMKENDAPFSTQYESYSLENLNGAEYHIDGFADYETVFEKMNISCPKCNLVLGKNHLVFTRA